MVICLYFMYSILYTVSPSPKNKTIQYERLPSMEEHIISCAIPLLLSSPVRVRIAAWFGWTARGCCTPCHCRAPPTCRAAPRPAQNCSSLKRSHPDVERENRHLDNHLLAGSWPLMRECWGQKTALLTSDQYHWSFIIWFSDPVGLNQDLFSSLAVARVGVPGLSVNVWLLWIEIYTLTLFKTITSLYPQCIVKPSGCYAKGVEKWITLSMSCNPFSIELSSACPKMAEKQVKSMLSNPTVKGGCLALSFITRRFWGVYCPYPRRSYLLWGFNICWWGKGILQCGEGDSLWRFSLKTIQLCRPRH